MINTYVADPHQVRLMKKWSPIINAGDPIDTAEKKLVLAQVLENTQEFFKNKGLLNEAGVAHGAVSRTGTLGNSGVKDAGKGYAAADSTGWMQGQHAAPYNGGVNGDYYLPNVVMPMLRRIMPDLIANDLVGVQPLNGPVGYALAYRPLYGAESEEFHGHNPGNQEYGLTTQEIGYNPTRVAHTGVKGKKPDLTGDAADAWTTYMGEDDRWLGEGYETGKGEWLELNHDYPTVTFGLMKTAVEAKTRKLAAQWSPELAEDMQAMHGIDVEKEMVNTLTYEVGAEIDRQIITEMVKAACVGGSIAKWNPAEADGLDQMGRLATLLTLVSIEANNIAIRTKRGAGNFVVTTPRVCALLQQLSMNKFTSFRNGGSIPTVPDTGVGALTKVGYINDDSQLLIRDAWTQSTSSDYLLLGYKGRQAGDSGIIYCPYIPLQLAKVLQPNTFTPSVGARTRYGVMSNPWDAKNFYAFIRITGVDANTRYNFGTDNRTFIGQTSTLDNKQGSATQVVVGEN